MEDLSTVPKRASRSPNDNAVLAVISSLVTKMRLAVGLMSFCSRWVVMSGSVMVKCFQAFNGAFCYCPQMQFQLFCCVCNKVFVIICDGTS